MASAEAERLPCLQMQSYWLVGRPGTRRLDRRGLWPSFARDSTTAVLQALTRRAGLNCVSAA